VIRCRLGPTRKCIYTLPPRQRDRTVATDFRGNRKYSCDTAADTLQCTRAIVEFAKPYSFLINTSVVNSSSFKICLFDFDFDFHSWMFFCDIHYATASIRSSGIDYGNLLIRNGWSGCAGNLRKICT
ncbi:hypothetical protein SDJN02_01148, partial [Cucurbita argyrosperma subsp. argyrosperma]